MNQDERHTYQLYCKHCYNSWTLDFIKPVHNVPCPICGERKLSFQEPILRKTVNFTLELSISIIGWLSDRVESLNKKLRNRSKNNE